MLKLGQAAGSLAKPTWLWRHSVPEERLSGICSISTVADSDINLLGFDSHLSLGSQYLKLDLAFCSYCSLPVSCGLGHQQQLCTSEGRLTQF